MERKLEMKMSIEVSERVKRIPPYLFVELNRMKREAKKQGKDVIDLGVGDPDIPTPDFVVDELYDAAKVLENQRYPLDSGLSELREEIAVWYKRRFDVKVDPESEILPLIGSKEGIAHIPLGIINRGDAVLVPDPGYPAYAAATILADGNPVNMPLLEENDFLPNFSAIDDSTLKKSKMMYLNYPNNPTSACADEDFFKNAVSFASNNNIVVCHDAAYSEIAYNGYKPLSFLSVDGAKNVGVEFHSLSKTYNMTGWRLGFAVGNEDIISFLAKVKSNVDSGVFTAVQRAGIAALKHGDVHIEANNKIYQERRDIVVSNLTAMGWKVRKPKATFYVWVPVPPGYTSAELCKKILKETAVVVTPGNGFGHNGEGYFRIALTVEKERLAEAMQRIRKMHE